MTVTASWMTSQISKFSQGCLFRVVIHIPAILPSSSRTASWLGDTSPELRVEVTQYCLALNQPYHTSQTFPARASANSPPHLILLPIGSQTIKKPVLPPAATTPVQEKIKSCLESRQTTALAFRMGGRLGGQKGPSSWARIVVQ